MTTVLVPAGGQDSEEVADELDGSVNDLSTDLQLVEAVPTGPVVPDVEALGWEPVLDDDFDGGELDESVWSMWHIGGSYRPREAVRVDPTHPGETSEGFLTLTAFSRPDHDGNLQHHVGGITTAQGGQDWRAPAEAGFLPTYGYVEARVKMRAEPGTTAAFWLMPRTGHGSPFRDPGVSGPEIDIFEWSGSDDDVDGRLHWDGFDEDHKTHGEGLSTNPTGTPLWDNFHTWSLLWTPDGYRMYLDGYEYFSSDDAIAYHPERLILSQHLFGWNGSIPDDGYGDVDESTNTVVVDYVKWWQKPVSAIPDQTTSVNEPLSIPFSVTDYFYSAAEHDSPGSVQVTATSSNQSLIPDAHLAVSGNGPDEPSGSLADREFENGDESWDLSGAATIWDGRAHSPPNSLRLTKEGGRATQTLTGLDPETTYMLGLRYNLEVDWTDLNGNGLVDCGPDEHRPCEADDEDLEPIQDARAEFDWGVSDFDASLDGGHEVVEVHTRNAWQERQSVGRRVNQDEFSESYVTFTTGPETTTATVFFDNTRSAGSNLDSNVSIDTMYLQPLVPPDRTVTVQPQDGAVGDSTITLTATDANEEVLGSTAFTVSVDDDGSFTNGAFEDDPGGVGWNLGGQAEVVTPDLFAPDRVLQLAEKDNSTAIQQVTGLRPDTDYVLRASGRVEPPEPGDSNEVTFGVTNHGGGTVVEEITTTDWSSASLSFRTGPESTQAEVVLLDWDTTDGASWADDVRVSPADTSSTPPGMTAPILASLDEEHLITGRPHTLLVDQLLASITGVTSSNPDLLPDRNISLTGEGRYRTIGLTPLPDRTGEATLTFTYTDQGSPHTFELPIVVSDAQLESPGLEDGAGGWVIPDSSGLAGDGGQRSGDVALEVGDTSGGSVSQTLTGLDYNTTYVLGGWAKGDVTVTVETTQRDHTDNPATVTESWGGGDWEEGQLVFTTGQCATCSPDPENEEGFPEFGTAEVRIDNGVPDDVSWVDDLYLVQTPSLRPVRGMSLSETQTVPTWRTRTEVDVGGVPASSLWRDDVVHFSSSDETVVPLDNLLLDADLDPPQPESTPAWPYEWSLHALSAGKTGRSDVTLTLTDPETGVGSSQTFPVTVNAGSLANGDFEDGLSGWHNSWVSARYDHRPLRPWRQLGSDHDGVLRIWHGVVGYHVTGLDPGQEYVVQGRVFGDGSSVAVRADDYPDLPAWGTRRGEVAVDQVDGWGPLDELRFTPLPDDPDTPDNDESDVWIFVQDLTYDPDDPDVEPDTCSGEDGTEEDCRLRERYNYYPCHPHDAGPERQRGQSCFDNLALFRATDVD